MSRSGISCGAAAQVEDRMDAKWKDWSFNAMPRRSRALTGSDVEESVRCCRLDSGLRHDAIRSP